MELLHLPFEILIQIIEETMPEGFENFILTCKKIYHASGDFLQKHNRLSRTYKSIYYAGFNEAGYSDMNPFMSSLHLLLRIADEPLIARYILLINFDGDGTSLPTLERDYSTFYPVHFDEDGIRRDQFRDSSNMFSLVKKSPYLRSAGVDPRTALDYMVSESEQYSGGPGLAKIFLLSLLPNVTWLGLPRIWELPRENRGRPNELARLVSSLVSEVVIRANGPPHLSAGLSRLTTILPSDGYAADSEISTFTPLISINSVENFYSTGCRSAYTGHARVPFSDPSWDNFRSGLQVLELAGCCVNPGGLQIFLFKLRRLQVFRLDHEPGSYSHHECDRTIDARAIMEAIEGGAGGTLEVLSFVERALRFPVTKSVQSMKGFVKLRELKLDMRLVFNLAVDDIVESWEVKCASKVPRLSDLLPPSIESLCLVVGFSGSFLPYTSHHDLDCLFSEVAKDKDQKLPKLNKIVIRYSRIGLSESPAVPHAVSATELFKDGVPYCPMQQWRADLASLASSVDVTYVEVAENKLRSATEGYFAPHQHRS